VVPVLLNVLILTAAGLLLAHFFPELVSLIWRKPESALWRLLWYVFCFFMGGVAVVLGLLLFFLLQGVLAAPFNDRLSERVEEILAGHEPPNFHMGRFLQGLLLTVGHELLKFAMLGSCLGVLWIVCMLVIPVAGSVVFTVLGGGISGFFFAYDFHDYALSRRRCSFRAKWGLLWRNAAMTLGFGTTVVLALVVPLAGIFVPPFATVGGTILCLDYERYGHIPKPQAKGR